MDTGSTCSLSPARVGIGIRAERQFVLVTYLRIALLQLPLDILLQLNFIYTQHSICLYRQSMLIGRLSEATPLRAMAQHMVSISS